MSFIHTTFSFTPIVETPIRFCLEWRILPIAYFVLVIIILKGYNVPSENKNRHVKHTDQLNVKDKTYV